MDVVYQDYYVAMDTMIVVIIQTNMVVKTIVRIPNFYARKQQHALNVYLYAMVIKIVRMAVMKQIVHAPQIIINVPMVVAY